MDETDIHPETRNQDRKAVDNHGSRAPELVRRPRLREQLVELGVPLLGVRPQCRFRHRVTEYVSESGTKWMSGRRG